MKLRVASRASELAMAQAHFVISLLKAKRQDIEFEIVNISTAGDQDRSVPLWKLEGVGFFTTQIEKALKDGVADIAVHSFKDLPTCEDRELAIAAVCDRRFVEDVLVAGVGVRSLSELKAGARVGTSSMRRIAQIKRMRPDLETATIRGNVEGRIRKLDEGQYDAIVLARAGLERLGLGGRISMAFNLLEFLPAPAQGALAVQVRAGDMRAKELVGMIDDPDARISATCERRVMEILEGGCHAPVGTYGRMSGEKFVITACVSDLDGSGYIEDTFSGQTGEAMEIAERLAKSLLDRGAKKILESIRTI